MNFLRCTTRCNELSICCSQWI